MIESLLNPDVVEQKPWQMLFVAILIGIVATFLAVAIGRGGETGHLVIAFASIAAAPLMVHIMHKEEKADEELETGLVHLLSRHWDVFQLYGYYFIGIIIAISVVYSFFPGMDVVFSTQVEEINTIQNIASGRVISSCDLVCLFNNNIGVLVLVFIFSLILGAGAVYIISWNASIVGVLIGMVAKSSAETSGNPLIIEYLIALPLSLLRLSPHGFFEIGSYFFAGLAGGILSAAMIKGHLPKKVVIKDVSLLFAIAILFVAIGAVIEAGY